MALVGLLAALFVTAVVLCAAETALVRVTDLRARTLASTGGRRGRRLAALVDDLPTVLNTVLLGELVAQIGAATVVGLIAVRWLGDGYVAVSSAALTLVLFVYTEVIPKTYAVRRPDDVGLLVAYPVTVVAFLLRPIVRLLVAFADLQIPGRTASYDVLVTEAELRALAHRAATSGEISESDRTLIERSFEFGDRTVREVMVPRPDVVAIASTTSVEEAQDAARRAGHRRLLVHDGDIDRVTGVVAVADLHRTAGDAPVAEVARDVSVVPETTRLPAVLRSMKQTGTRVALVIDEYGSTAGMVTIEDLAEELIGTMTESERDREIVVRRLDRRTWVVRGDGPIHELEEVLGVDLPHEMSTTVSGVVADRLGRLPRTGDVVRVGPVSMRVLATRRRRVRLVEVTREEAQGLASPPALPVA